MTARFRLYHGLAGSYMLETTDGEYVRWVSVEASQAADRKRIEELEAAIGWFCGLGPGWSPPFPPGSPGRRYEFRTVARETFPVVKEVFDRLAAQAAEEVKGG